MTVFPGSPHLAKGALISIAPDRGKDSAIEYQLVPDPALNLRGKSIWATAISASKNSNEDALHPAGKDKLQTLA
jgi:hypothetical protein